MFTRPYRWLFVAASLAVLFLPGATVTRAAEEDPVAAAMKSLDEYMAAFNARDAKAWAATLNYPHIRIASGDVRITQTAEEYAAGMDFDAFAARYGWDHSEWDKRDVINYGADKVHFNTTFTRYTKDGKKIATYDSLYIVTKKDGHWGTLARSSFAP
jgi:hypothetical protein